MPTTRTFSLPRWQSRCVALASLALSPLHWAAAQLPGSPVLQNAWATSGIVAAIDASGGSGEAAYALAAAWAPGGARFQVSAGAGVQTMSASSTRVEYGGRAALPIASLMSGNLGIGAFAGIGGGQSSSAGSNRVNLDIPVGASVGYRHTIGASSGASIYASPMYVWVSGKSGTSGVVRLGLGLDVGLSARWGVTGGVELGQSASAGKAGPAGTLYGLGLSYVLGAR